MKNNCEINNNLNKIKQNLFLFIGKNTSDNLIYLPEKSLYQNILVTGTIGTGKTSSCMYPFTKQLICFYNDIPEKKLGLLILDVKGNFHKKVLEYANIYNRKSDLYIIEVNGKIKYNPLDKPNLKPKILANRLKTILTLFSPNNSDSYWLDKVEDILVECIKFCRLYNNSYVTFLEIHNLITLPNYYIEKLSIIKSLFLSGNLSKKDCYDVLTSLNFFEKEFFCLDDRTLAILKSEITRITNCFISDFDILNTFCPKKEDINFHGFKDLVNNGKIVVLNMNIAEYKNLSKIIATYLKLDFQTEVLSRLSYYDNTNFRSVGFISDEFHEYISSTDADFFSQSREAKCINIVSTQSYSSFLHILNNPYTVKVIIQNLVNKLWFRTDDLSTIDDIQKQIGKEDKIKLSKTISENANETFYSYLTNSFNSKKSNLSESINQYSQLDFIYDTNFFTQHLKTFHCLSFLSDGHKILPPMEIKLFPYFQKFN
ncbi:MAG: hypothetical protein HFJ53_04440 [Clostridia bacterium]|nr:hypothetical protein [Clostridia bacterium]